MIYKVTRGSAGASTGAHRFKTFEDLEVYKAAQEFRKAMYAVSRCLPDFEKYDLGRQIRRAAVSLTKEIRNLPKNSTSWFVCNGCNSCNPLWSR